MSDHPREQLPQYHPPRDADKVFALFALMWLDLSPSAKRVAAALIWHANSRNGRCDPGLERLQYLTGLCRSAVKKALGQLSGKGIVTRRRRGSASNAYKINWDLLRGVHVDFEERGREFSRQRY